ncbi:MAG: hypothetical protein OEY93_07485 [Anaerolineae bacterium]|nr:hypothetical protein [Anaerolineae bacterium]
MLSDGTTTYLYGAGRIGQFDTAWTYPLGDALRSVRQLTDAAGTVILGQNYAPYGSVISSFGTGASNYGFANKWTDTTGLQHLRARYMDPGTGRYISHDSWPTVVALPGCDPPPQGPSMDRHGSALSLKEEISILLKLIGSGILIWW